jgi:hypothetical protein
VAHDMVPQQLTQVNEYGMNEQSGGVAPRNCISLLRRDDQSVFAGVVEEESSPGTRIRIPLSITQNDALTSKKALRPLPKVRGLLSRRIWKWHPVAGNQDKTKWVVWVGLLNSGCNRRFHLKS